MTFDPSAARSGSVFSTNPFYQGAWLCYINGVEVPIAGFDVQSGVWQIPQFRVHLVPDPSIERLGSEDRVQVAVFVMDQWAGADPEWRLLVDGEIIGWSFNSMAGQRVMSFSCIGNIHVFQQLYFFFMNTVDDVVAAQAPTVRASGAAVAGLFYPYSLFHQGLFVTQPQLTALQERVNANRNPRPGQATVSPALAQQDAERADSAAGDSAAPIKVPFELVYNVIRAIIDKNIPNENRALPMMNFFARHVRKTRMHNRFVRLPILEDPGLVTQRRGVFPILEAARADEALAAMQRTVATQIGNSGSIWDMLRQILGTVYMEVGMITNPACVITSGAGEIKSLAPLNSRMPISTGVRIVSTSVTPTFDTVEGETRNTAPNITPGRTDPGVQTAVTAAATEIIRAVLSQTPDAETTSRINTLREFTRHSATGGSFNQELRLFLTALSEVIFDRDILEIADLTAAQQVNIRAGRPPPRQQESRHAVATGPALDPIRLAQYFVKPQFLFGVPPVCNVIFPSMIDQWSFDENYINQPTRVYVNDSAMTRLLRANGPNREQMLHALTVGFPEEADIVLHHRLEDELTSGGTGQGNAGSGNPRESGRNLLIWPEEFYKGPVTARFDLPSWFQMLRIQENASTPTSTTPTGATPPAGTQPGSTTQTTQNPATHQGGPTSSAGAQANPNTQLAATTGPVRSDTAGAAFGAAARRGISEGRPRAITEVASPIFPDGRSHGEFLVLRSSQPNYRFIVGGLGTRLVASRFQPATTTHIINYTSLIASAAEDRQRTVYQLPFLAALTGALIPYVRSNSAYPSTFTDEQVRAVSFALAFQSALDTGYGIGCLNWNFSNTTRVQSGDLWNPIGLHSGRWFAANTAYRTINEGLEAHVDLFPNDRGQRTYERALRVLLGKVLAPRAVRNVPAGFMSDKIAALPAAQRQRFQDLGVFPDQFYMMLGEIGFYQRGGGVHNVNWAFRQVSRMLDVFDAVMRMPTLPALEPSSQPSRGYPQLVEPPHTALLARTHAGFRTQQQVRARIERIDRLPADRTIPGIPTEGVEATIPVVAQTGTDATETDTTQRTSNFADLFRIYAQYEYQRRRYEQRNVGATLRFNPYLVPGFPCVLFDSMRTRVHVVGYVMAISHSGSTNGNQSSLGTQVQISFARTLPEFLANVRDDSRRFAEAVAAAPADVITEIRRVVQDEQRAEQFYGRLFYGRGRPGGTPAAFHFTQALAFATDGLAAQQIIMEGIQPDEAARIRENAAQGRSPPNPNDPNIRIEIHEPTASTAATGATTATGRTPGLTLTPEQRRLLSFVPRDSSEAASQEQGLREAFNIPRGAAFDSALRAALGAAPGVSLATAVTNALNAPPSTTSTGASADTDQPSGETERSVRIRARNNLSDPERELVPRPNSVYERAFDSYDVAMKFAARPICTLLQYIQFHAGGAPLSELLTQRVVEPGDNNLAYHVVSVITQNDKARAEVQNRVVDHLHPAHAFKRIYRYRQGPGNPPTPEQRGFTDSPGATVSAAFSGVAADYPQTRRDWDEILLRYRDKVRTKLSPGV